MGVFVRVNTLVKVGVGDGVKVESGGVNVLVGVEVGVKLWVKVWV